MRQNCKRNPKHYKYTYIHRILFTEYKTPHSTHFFGLLFSIVKNTTAEHNNTTNWHFGFSVINQPPSPFRYLVLVAFRTLIQYTLCLFECVCVCVLCTLYLFNMSSFFFIFILVFFCCSLISLTLLCIFLTLNMYLSIMFM